MILLIFKILSLKLALTLAAVTTTQELIPVAEGCWPNSTNTSTLEYAVTLSPNITQVVDYCVDQCAITDFTYLYIDANQTECYCSNSTDQDLELSSSECPTVYRLDVFVMTLTCPPQASLLSQPDLVPFNQVVINSQFECSMKITSLYSNLTGALYFHCDGEYEFPLTDSGLNSYSLSHPCEFTQVNEYNLIEAKLCPNKTSGGDCASVNYTMPSVDSFLVEYSYEGCFTSGYITTDNTSSDAMTVEMCLKFCSSNSSMSPYAALNNGTRCLCVSSLNWNLKGLATQCNATCAGNSSETCGGSGLIISAYSLTYESMYFYCRTAINFNQPLDCSFRLVSFRFSFNTLIEWGDGSYTYYNKSSFDVKKDFTLEKTYTHPGIYEVAFHWLDWQNTSLFYPCQDCPTMRQNVTVQKITVSSLSTSNMNLNSVATVTISIYTPQTITFNYKDFSTSVVVNAVDCNYTKPLTLTFNHTYELSGVYNVTFGDNDRQFYWNATSEKLVGFYNTYACWLLNVKNGEITKFGNSAYHLDVDMPDCSSGDNCISIAGVGEPFPINISISEQNGSNITEGSRLVIDFGDTTQLVMYFPESTSPLDVHVNHTYNAVKSFYVNISFEDASAATGAYIVMDVAANPSNFDSLNSLGCYIDTTSNRTLLTSPLFDTNQNSIQNCLLNCSMPQNDYMGLKNRSQCFCSINMIDSLTSDQYCNLPCTGASNQICGGWQYMNVYQLSFAAFGNPCDRYYLPVNTTMKCRFVFNYNVYWFELSIDWNDTIVQNFTLSKFTRGFTLELEHFFGKSGTIRIITTWTTQKIMTTLNVQNVVLYGIPEFIAVGSSFTYNIELSTYLPGIPFQVDYGDGSPVASFSTNYSANYPLNHSLSHTYHQPGYYNITTFDAQINPSAVKTIFVFYFNCTPSAVPTNYTVICAFQFASQLNTTFELSWGDGSLIENIHTGDYYPLVAFDQKHEFSDQGAFEIVLKWEEGSEIRRTILVEDIHVYELASIVGSTCPFSFIVSFGVNENLLIDFGDNIWYNMSKTSNQSLSRNYSLQHVYENKGDYVIKIYSNDMTLLYTSTTIRAFSFECPSQPVFNSLACTIQFDSANSNQSLSFRLDWGDGSSESQNFSTSSISLSRNYVNAGKYNVTLYWSNSSMTRPATILIQTITVIGWPSYFYVNQSLSYTIQASENSGVISVNYGDSTTQATFDTASKPCPCNFTLSHTYSASGSYSMLVSDQTSNYSTNPISIYPTGDLDLSNYNQIMDLLTQSVDISNCLVNCSSHGVCKLVSASLYGCVCYENYTGAACDAHTDPCYESPCLNQGECNTYLATNQNSSYSFNCSCADYYYGSLCQLSDVDSVCSNWTCSSNGYCSVNGASGDVHPECKCYSGYSGTHCETESNYMKTVKITITSSTVLAFVIIALFYVTFVINDALNLTVFREYKIVRNEKTSQIDFKRAGVSKPPVEVKIEKFHYHS